MQGLYSKYRVIKNATGEEVFGVFILKPETDPFARPALAVYADVIAKSNPKLAADIRQWLQDIVDR